MLDKVFNIASAIVTVALAAVIVGSPHTRGIIRDVTSGFAKDINAAQKV